MKRLLFLLTFVLLALKGFGQETEGTVVIGTIVPTDSLDNYATHDDYFGKVAFRCVPTVIQRDLIPQARRILGMKVFCVDVNRTYRLQDCYGNGCWVEDIIDTLHHGTFSTGKITIQPIGAMPSLLFDIYNIDGYQRFGISKNGLLLAGRRFPMTVNVDALAYIGDNNELTGSDAFVIGKNSKVEADSSGVIGFNLSSPDSATLKIGYNNNYISFKKDSIRFFGKYKLGSVTSVDGMDIFPNSIKKYSVVTDTFISLANLANSKYGFTIRNNSSYGYHIDNNNNGGYGLWIKNNNSGSNGLYAGTNAGVFSRINVNNNSGYDITTNNYIGFSIGYNYSDGYYINNNHSRGFYISDNKSNSNGFHINLNSGNALKIDNNQGIIINGSGPGKVLDITTATTTASLNIDQTANGINELYKKNGTEVYRCDSYGNIISSGYSSFSKYYVSSLNSAPSTSTDSGVAGEIRFTSDYIYICVATDTWKRVAISNW